MGVSKWAFQSGRFKVGVSKTWAFQKRGRFKHRRFKTGVSEEAFLSGRFQQGASKWALQGGRFKVGVSKCVFNMGVSKRAFAVGIRMDCYKMRASRSAFLGGLFKLSASKSTFQSDRFKMAVSKFLSLLLVKLFLNERILCENQMKTPANLSK